MESQGTILLADDEDTFAQATQTLLQGEGYDCHTVGDARNLSVALQGNNYDLLITDLNMPGNQVMEMVDELQSRSNLLPVIVVTGYPSISTAVDSVRLNVLEYLVKPIDYPHLLESVRKGIDLKRELQTIRSTGDVVRDRLDQLQKIEKAFMSVGQPLEVSSTEGTTHTPSMSDLQSKLHEVLDLLKRDASRSIRSDDPASVVSPPPMISDYFQLREGIHNAIQVLQQTKGSFRSKELANLRLNLQDLLKKTTPNQ